ncbi:MAG TPA: hypothetical protein VK897_22185 [Anaerolineales bacterium]|nr:hypothetical protein [Anaerolineales bacterium]
MSTNNRVQSVENEAQVQYQPAFPNPDLQRLDRLVGTWKIFDPSGKGAITGQVTYEWVEGGFFLRQHFDLVHEGHRNKGIEMIGHFQMFGEDASEEIKTRVYSFLDGMTLDYVYELVDDTLIIWAGEKGSPAYFKGQFSEDGNMLTGAWVYPGGGYESRMTRVR